MGRKYEISTVGIDEALQGVSADPFGALPSGVGLRVPAFIPNNSNPALNRYLFLLATRRLGRNERVRLRGWRQLVTIGVNAPLPPVPAGFGSRPVEFEVITSTFRFPDGNVSWHLVREPPQGVPSQRPNTDLANFAFVDSSTPALLYQSAVFTPGPTGYYVQNLSAYTPPVARLSTWEPIAGLGNVHDLRTDWREDSAWNYSLDEVVQGEARISLYASVLQTNPGTRPQSNAPAAQTVGDPLEENFITKWNAQGSGGLETNPGVRYWRVAGALILEDC